MPTFTPPTDNFQNFADFDIDTPRTVNNNLAYRLLRHLASGPRGRNVYKLVNGTYVENEPADFSTVAITYQGGHVHEVSETEASSLSAAGYSAYIS